MEGQYVEIKVAICDSPSLLKLTNSVATTYCLVYTLDCCKLARFMGHTTWHGYANETEPPTE
jgi:hypothetical protein